MNPLMKFILKITSSPQIDMQEDYLWIRKMQRVMSKLRSPDIMYDYLDEKIYSKEGDHEIPVRIFYPEEEKHSDHIIYLHGGGWVIGDIDTYSQACINLANALGRRVFSIDYRRAPEHPFPAGFNDCLQAVKSLLASPKFDNQKWLLIGDSAGGNLAATVTLKLKEENHSLPYKQILLYPVTYWDHSKQSPFQSVRTYGHDYGLTIKKIQEFMAMYAPDETTRRSPLIAPLMADDLNHHPPTLIITAEYDPLRDEGEAYGKALKRAGTDVQVARILESPHGFITYPKEARPLADAYQIMKKFLKE